MPPIGLSMLARLRAAQPAMEEEIQPPLRWRPATPYPADPMFPEPPRPFVGGVGPEPWQVEAEIEGEEEKRARESARLRNLRSIAVSGNPMANAFGMPGLEPVGIDLAIAEHANTLRPREAAAYKGATGIDLRGARPGMAQTLATLRQRGQDMTWDRQMDLAQLRGAEESRALRAKEIAILDEDRDARRDDLADRRAVDRRERFVKAFTTDPATKLAETMAVQGQMALDFIASGDTQAMKNIIPQLARMLGEKGALSDADRREMRNRLGIANKIEDFVNESLAGRLTPALVESYRKMAEMAMEASPRVKDRIAKERAQQYSRAWGGDWEELYEMARPESSAGAPEGSGSMFADMATGTEPGKGLTTGGRGITPAAPRETIMVPKPKEATGRLQGVVRVVFRNKVTGETRSIPVTDRAAIESGRQKPDWEIISQPGPRDTNPRARPKGMGR